MTQGSAWMFSCVLDVENEAVTSSERTDLPVLPPCRVCGAKASGLHYGVNACQACKSFFRRSRGKTVADYDCIGGSGICDITYTIRPPCPKCRYKKCVQSGMSRDACKNGRYTLERKHKNIKEVKGITNKNQHISDSPFSEKRLEEIRVYLAALNKFLGDSADMYNAFMKSVSTKQKAFMEERTLQESLFGKMSPISKDEYKKIFETTGIDIDNRRAVNQSWMPYAEWGFKRLVEFSKIIPGFRQLPMEDRIHLLKASRFEAWLVGGWESYNVRDKLFTCYNGNTLNLEDFIKRTNEDIAETEFELAGRLQKLGLYRQEQGVIVALTILAGDRCVLQEPKQVEESQAVMFDALSYLLKKNHPNETKLITQIVQILTDLRNLTQLYESYKIELVNDWVWLGLDTPKIVREFFED